MTKNNWKVQSSEILSASPVMPVVVIQNALDAVPLARALLAGGIKVLEITLCTAAAMDAIKAISEEVDGVYVGAGMITTPEQLQTVTDAGAVFAISPGLSPKLLAAANQSEIALIPGVASVSELMLGMEYGLDHFKFFPAEAAGGIPMLKGIAESMPQITFCPAGGISPSNYNDYLALENVACVGGSRLVPTEAVKNKDWDTVTALAKEAVANATGETFFGDSDEQEIATSSEELKKSIENGAYSQFGLGKISPKRAAIFAALLEDPETVSMINDLMSKLKIQQDVLLKIQEILGKDAQDTRKQVREIKKVVSKLK